MAGVEVGDISKSWIYPEDGVPKAGQGTGRKAMMYRSRENGIINVIQSGAARAIAP